MEKLPLAYCEFNFLKGPLKIGLLTKHCLEVQSLFPSNPPQKPWKHEAVRLPFSYIRVWFEVHLPLIGVPYLYVCLLSTCSYNSGQRWCRSVALFTGACRFGVVQGTGHPKHGTNYRHSWSPSSADRRATFICSSEAASFLISWFREKFTSFQIISQWLLGRHRSKVSWWTDQKHFNKTAG